MADKITLREREFIGRGLTFPMQVDSQGRLALASGNSEIEQAIRLILDTSPGERVMRPEFGCRAWELIYEPRDATTEARLVSYVRAALERWEPRIDLHGVDVIEDSRYEDAVLVNIRYNIKDSHDDRSIVYPFFIENEE